MLEGNNTEQLTIKQKIKLVLGSLGVISCKNDKTVNLTFADTSSITERLEGGEAKYTQVPIFFEINDAYMVSLSPQITGDRIKPCMEIIRQNCRIFENVVSEFVREDKARKAAMSDEEKERLAAIIKDNGGVLVPNYFKELDGYLEKRSDKYFEDMNKVPTTNEMINDLSSMMFFRKGSGTNILFLPYNGKMNDALYKKCLKAEKRSFDFNGWNFYFSATTSTSVMNGVKEKIKANFEYYNYIFEVIEEQMGMKKAPKFVAYVRATEPLEMGK